MVTRKCFEFISFAQDPAQGCILRTTVVYIVWDVPLQDGIFCLTISIFLYDLASSLTYNSLFLTQTKQSFVISYATMNTNSTLMYSRKILPAFSVQCHFYCSHIKTTEEKMSTGFKGSGSFSQICLVFTTVLHTLFVHLLFSCWHHCAYLFLFLPVVEIDCPDIPALSLAIFMNTLIFLQQLVSRRSLWAGIQREYPSIFTTVFWVRKILTAVL